MIIEARIGNKPQRLEVPDGSTPEQIDEVLTHFASSAPQQPKGFVDRLGEDFSQRKQQLLDAQAREETGQQSKLSSKLQVLGTGAGTALDLAGNVIGSGARYARDLIPQPIDDFAANQLTQAKDYIGDSAFGRGAKYLLGEGAELAQEHPVAAANLGSAANIAGFILGVKAAQQIGNAGINTGKNIVKNAVEKEVVNIPKAPILSSEAIAANSGKLYKQAEAQGGILKPSVTNNFIDSIQTLKPQSRLGQRLKGNTTFTELVDDLSKFKDEPLDLASAQELDEHLGDVIDGFMENGRLTKQGKKIYDIQTAFRDTLEKAGEADAIGGKAGFNTWREGQKEWAKAAKTRDIEKILARAEATDNPATSIKAGLRALAGNPKRLRGYSPEEQALIKKAARDGIIPETLRTVIGSRLISTGAGAIGGGIPGAIAGNALSAVARGAAGKMKSAEVDNILRAIQAGKKVSPAAVKKLPAQEAKEVLQFIFLNSGNRKFLTNSAAATAGAN